jgi:clorobiocin biosynthesis protein CloN5
MDELTVQSQVKTFIDRELLRGQDHVEADSPLLELGIIESLSLVTLIGFLQKEFQIEIPDRDLLPTNFGSVKSISKLVLRLHASAAA